MISKLAACGLEVTLGRGGLLSSLPSWAALVQLNFPVTVTAHFGQELPSLVLSTESESSDQVPWGRTMDSCSGRECMSIENKPGIGSQI